MLLMKIVQRVKHLLVASSTVSRDGQTFAGCQGRKTFRECNFHPHRFIGDPMQINFRTPNRRKVGLKATAVAALVTAGLSLALAHADPGNGNSNGKGNGKGNGQTDHGWAKNPYSPAYDHPWRRGVIPTIDVKAKMDKWDDETYHNGQPYAGQQPGAAAGQLAYNGGNQGVGVNSGISKVYVVFYGTQWGNQTTDAKGDLKFSNDAASAASAVQEMFRA